MSENGNTVVAKVGEKEITNNDLEAVLRTINPQAVQQFRSEQGRKNLIHELVNQELLYLEALDKGLDKENEFLLELERAKESMLKQYAINKLLLSETVSEEEINNYYNDNKELFNSNNSINASHILVNSIEKANEVSKEINSGLSFGEAAKKYSSCPSKDKGGELGFFTKGSMVPEFEKVAFELELNVVSEPVKTQFGYHLIKVVDKKETQPKSFDEVKSKIREQILTKKQQNVFMSKVNELKNTYEVEIK
jgi:peptidyl-prolyl cis-trans isomerase C